MYLRRNSLRKTLARILLVVLVLFSTVEVLHVRQSLARAEGDSTAVHAPGPERIFIAGIFWNNEAILRSSLNAALVDLVEHLGPHNVFISVHESGSWDNTKDALRELDEAFERIGADRRITTSNATHLDEISVESKGEGWVDTPQGQREMRRIPYLAKQRNIGLEPLAELAERGVQFEKVLFINDVVFSTEDALQLLDTNGGEYAAACSMDFKNPPYFYDTFALRDSEGNEHLMPTWPYFRSRVSRDAMSRYVPVPVSSCWNGMVAMPAQVFTGPSALRFRGIPDSLAAAHLEGSECCLIHADNPFSRSKGVFVNPRVRVGYTSEAYEAMRNGEVTLSSIIIGLRLWENRIRRWTTTPMLKTRAVASRLQRWYEDDPTNEEPGGFCLINEMQVLRKIGWAHV
ncbi:putative polysaccharide export protein [Bimuria novae-zelandiae CBS 107.79]|uniref:Putative polysaccharide export protein n=1 Tax=Bimuria novae-zelandiae CBS 107.79 TaxID=1447943 RepID=A0A6A5VAM6_9PLEO|nr:putative polysaccharide export protein [Bimuria novae-zelandiae CBS 107.79]